MAQSAVPASSLFPVSRGTTATRSVRAFVAVGRRTVDWSKHALQGSNEMFQLHAVGVGSRALARESLTL